MSWFSSEPKLYLGEPAILGVLVTHRQRRRLSGLVWSGNDIFVRGTWRPPSFVEKLLSGTRAKVTVIVFTEETWWPSSNTLSECYNNVDVGVPLWLTEPRDKPRVKSLLSHIPLTKLPHFIIAICVTLLS